MSGRVIVVGSVNVDLVVTTERLPAPGETVIGGRFAQHHGGKGGNQAVAAARLGAPTFFVGAVGDDAFGDAARAALEAEGVDVAGLLTLDDEATGVALILVDETGENSIAVAGGANAALDARSRSGPRSKRLELTRATSSSSVTRSGPARPTRRSASARIAGATTILNPAPASGLDRPTLDARRRPDAERGRARDAGRRARPAVGPGQAVARRRSRATGPCSSASAPTGALLVDGDGSRGDPGADGRRRRHGRGRRHAQRRAGGRPGGGPRSLEAAARRAVVAASLAVTRAGAREGMPTRRRAGGGPRRLVRGQARGRCRSRRRQTEKT